MKLGAISAAGKDLCAGALRMLVCRADSGYCPAAGEDASSTSPAASWPSLLGPSSCGLRHCMRLHLHIHVGPHQLVHLRAAHSLPHVCCYLLSCQRLTHSRGRCECGAALYRYRNYLLSFSLLLRSCKLQQESTTNPPTLKSAR